MRCIGEESLRDHCHVRIVHGTSITPSQHCVGEEQSVVADGWVLNGGHLLMIKISATINRNNLPSLSTCDAIEVSNIGLPSMRGAEGIAKIVRNLFHSAAGSW